MMEEIEFEMLVQFLLIGGLSGVAYSVWNYITSTNPGSFEIKRFVASVLFGAGIGVFGGYTVSSMGILIEDVEWWVLMGGLFLGNQSILQYVNRAIDYIWVYFFNAKVGEKSWTYDSWVSDGSPELTFEEQRLQAALPTGTPYYRKMNGDRRNNMIEDQPAQIQKMILDCVDQAETKTTWRYAIQAGAWIYLIEYGVLTGAKHYFYWQSGSVEWKPISVECIEKIRKSRKFPEYSQLT